jgi:hypothetical protein
MQNASATARASVAMLELDLCCCFCWRLWRPPRAAASFLCTRGATRGRLRPAFLRRQSSDAGSARHGRSCRTVSRPHRHSVGTAARGGKRRNRPGLRASVAARRSGYRHAASQGGSDPWCNQRSHRLARRYGKVGACVSEQGRRGAMAGDGVRRDYDRVGVQGPGAARS